MLAGAGAVGYATAAFSIAALLASLGNPGLGYAVLREVSLRGPRAYAAALLIAVTLGVALSALSSAFAGLYGGFMEFLPLVAAMTVFSLLTAVSLSALVASLTPEYVFTANLVSALVRVSAGIALVALGLGATGWPWRYCRHRLRP